MRVSFTQLMTYVRCPEHFLFRYVLGMKQPPRKVFKHGFAMHETLAYYYDQKKNATKGLRPSEAKEFFLEVFENALEDYRAELEELKPRLTKEYVHKENQIDIAELAATGVRGIETYLKQLAPQISPDLIEEPFSFQIAQGIELVGRLDLTDKRGIIHELKTSRNTPPKQDIRHDIQIAMYQMAYEQLLGRPPKGISKDYIVFHKREPKIVRFQAEKPFFNKKHLISNITTIAKAVQHNIFYCLHPTESWICSKEWCGYYKAHQELKKLGLAKFVAKYSKGLYKK